jgi:WD40 repeat protein
MIILDHVLKQLDSESITNARLTCRKWRNVIDQLLWNTNSGKKYLNGLLKNNFLYKMPNVSTIQLSQQIEGLIWDQDDIIVVATINDIHSKVMCYNSHTLGLRWENDKDYVGELIEIHGFNDYAIFVSCVLGIISFLRRSDGHCLYKSDTFISNYISVALVWKNRLAMVQSDLHCIKFFDVDFAAPNVLQMTQSVDTLSEICCMDNDKNDLISCSTISQLILWNFQTGEKVQTLETNLKFVNNNKFFIKVGWHRDVGFSKILS